VLGDAACAFVAFDGPQILNFRSRRRDRSPQEPGRLRDDALRTGALAGFGGDAALVLSGAGARSTADRLAADGLMTRVASLCPALGPAQETAAHPWLAARARMSVGRDFSTHPQPARRPVLLLALGGLAIVLAAQQAWAARSARESARERLERARGDVATLRDEVRRLEAASRTNEVGRRAALALSALPPGCSRRSRRCCPRASASTGST
jgi:hypothetical protein